MGLSVILPETAKSGSSPEYWGETYQFLLTIVRNMDTGYLMVLLSCLYLARNTEIGTPRLTLLSSKSN